MSSNGHFKYDGLSKTEFRDEEESPQQEPYEHTDWDDLMHQFASVADKYVLDQWVGASGTQS